MASILCYMAPLLCAVALSEGCQCELPTIPWYCRLDRRCYALDFNMTISKEGGPLRTGGLQWEE